MARSSLTRDLRKGDKVVASADLRGVPQGTKGKVALVEGLSWVRYWVRFDNGTAIGSVNRSHLATPEEWTRKLSGVEDVAVESDSTAASEADGGGADGASSGGVVTANGALVSQKLIDRAKAARARLAG
jgi:hypothetical protein